MTTKVRCSSFYKPAFFAGYRRTGFTLVELIVATFIFAVVASAVAAFTIYYLGSYTFSLEESRSVGYAQGALTTMVREIRESRMGENGAWPITQADDSTFVFYADVTNDGRTDKVRYFIDGTTLKKGVIQPTTAPVSYPPETETITVVSDYVDNAGNPLFRYYNGNWPADAINNPLPVSQRLFNTRYVSIYLRINIVNNTGANPFELNSGVQIRSLKDNL